MDKLTGIHKRSTPAIEESRSNDINPDSFYQLYNYGEKIVLTFEDLGVRSAFGLPGGAIAGIFNALSRSKLIQTTLCQHECGAAYMAMGRSLCASKPESSQHEIGLCFATAGPGITNLITGVAAAFEERVPVFVLTGNVASHLKGRGAAQDAFSTGIDAIRMLESVTACSRTVNSPEEIIPAIRELYELALRTRRPVHLNVPVDFAVAKLPQSELRKVSQDAIAAAAALHPPLDLQKADEAIQAFLRSARPLILAGHGVKTSGNGQLVRAIAERFDIPMIATSHAKGVIPEDHYRYFGTFGFASTSRATDFLEAYQPTALLILGSRLGELSSAGWSPLLQKPELRIHVDIDATQFNRIYPVTHPVHGDLGDFLELLVRFETDSEMPHARANNRLALFSSHQKLLNQKDQMPLQHGPADPVSIIQLLDFWLPDNVVLFSDIGNSMAWIIHHLEIREGQDFYLPLGLGSMGSGLCGAIGAKSAMPDRPVVCVTGDCSTLMHGTELLTAKNAGLGVKVIIFNDGGHGMVDHGHRLLGLNDVNVRFEEPVDFRLFASSLGVEAYQARSLQEFIRLPLDTIFASPHPVVIDVTIDGEAVPPILSRTRVLGQADRSN